MPWQLNGTFLRVNEDFSGSTVWQQDRNASYKVISERHDFHDNDLALGIQNSLNLDGLNTLRSNINMGGFTLVNLKPPTANTDIALYGGLVNSGSFNNTTRELTLTQRDGTPIPPIIIPATAAGGGGTVTEITAGEGVVMSPATITTTGTVSLKTIPEGAFNTNGIVNRIRTDVYGRVIEIGTTTIETASTNLGTQYQASLVTVTSSNGTNTDITGATGSQAGVMTVAQVNSLASALSTANSALQPGDVDLSNTRSSTSVTVTNTGGNNTTLSAASSSLAGVMSASDKAKLDGVNTSATKSDLGLIRNLANIEITNSGGTNVTLPMWDSPNQAGLFAGSITNTVPVSAAGVPDGFIWFVY